MATNPYFRKAVRSEQDLIDDLSVEVIKIHGFDMVYLPRTLVRKDELFGEDRSPSRFSTGREIEMLVESVDGFEGDGEIFSRIGLEIRDNVSLVVSRKRFEQEFSDLGIKTPREGDLLYFPISGAIFEINFVERENPFYQLNKISTYKITCSLFRYTGEDFETGWSDIDGITSDHVQKFTELVLGSGSGNYREGEYVYQGSLYAGATIVGKVEEWSSSTNTLLISGVTGTFQAGVSVVGNTSNATYTLGTAGITNVSAITDVITNNLDFEIGNLIDFTDRDPFSEGDL